MITAVAYEDRSDAMVGVQLLALSLAKYSPNFRLDVYSPFSPLRTSAVDLANVRWVETTDLVGQGWNVKPTILLRALEQSDQVLWIDSDVIVIAPVETMLQRVPTEGMIVSTEYPDPTGILSAVRAEGHGLKLGRKFPHSINSGVMLLDRRHQALLLDWQALLSGKAYQNARKLNAKDRPIHLVGDQDVLWALLSSEEHRRIDVDFFEVGRDIIMHAGGNGYTIQNRIKTLLGARPSLVHSYGAFKPWMSYERGQLSRAQYINLVCNELSPYHKAAQVYANLLGNPEWLKHRTKLAVVLDRVFLGNVELRGMPLAVLAMLAEKLK